jgi:hypothetical protein
VDQWREVYARCHGLEANDPKTLRVKDHYFPLLDAAYQDRDPQAWFKIMRNLNVGCPLPKDYSQWRVPVAPKPKVELRADLEETQGLPF